MKFDPGIISGKKLIKSGLIQWSPLIANEKALYITSLSRSFEGKILKRREDTIWVITLYNEELYAFNSLYSLEFAADNKVVSTESFLQSDLNSKAIQAVCHSAPPSAHVYSFTVKYSPRAIYSTKIDVDSQLNVYFDVSKSVTSSKNYFFYFEFIPIDGYDTQYPNGYRVYVVKFTDVFGTLIATIDNLISVEYDPNTATMIISLYSVPQNNYQHVYLHGITEE